MNTLVATDAVVLKGVAAKNSFVACYDISLQSDYHAILLDEKPVFNFLVTNETITTILSNMDLLFGFSRETSYKYKVYNILDYCELTRAAKNVTDTICFELFYLSCLITAYQSEMNDFGLLCNEFIIGNWSVYIVSGVTYIINTDKNHN